MVTQPTSLPYRTQFSSRSLTVALSRNLAVSVVLTLFVALPLTQARSTVILTVCATLLYYRSLCYRLSLAVSQLQWPRVRHVQIKAHLVDW